ncbi:hypothetical protein [Mesorhizobium australicum]|uniref:Uncharacterized protein n=1 Tax=Mesorhizobium australicum TaxID=536018 RepID=A0A1X7P7H1_9HYPH|nr:hypothetical protein [Mesorhizobium australicum]SMH46745.1 hypothetical protein SAMN02982922_3403 [Mesorhizobium australicum]
MHIARRNPHVSRACSRHFSQETVWLRLRTKDWDFFVADEVEAFAVIARHDVLDVEAMRQR